MPMMHQSRMGCERPRAEPLPGTNRGGRLAPGCGNQAPRRGTPFVRFPSMLRIPPPFVILSLLLSTAQAAHRQTTGRVMPRFGHLPALKVGMANPHLPLRGTRHLSANEGQASGLSVRRSPQLPSLGRQPCACARFGIMKTGTLAASTVVEASADSRLHNKDRERVLCAMPGTVL